MPLVAYSPLPTFAKLANEGEHLLNLPRANTQHIRELHIGLLNMMPDAALQSTERQFMRLIGNSNRIAQFYVHPFSLDGIERSEDTQDYIKRYYSSFTELSEKGLDALIITGANVPPGQFRNAPFWDDLTKVLDFARAKVTSTLCACLATHAAMEHFYNVQRVPLKEKCWGVFEHQSSRQPHPLIRNINTRFNVPHSRFNDIPRDRFDKANLRTLIQSADAGVHLAVSEDLFRFILFQGHPEYDRNSILKEYKREVVRFIAGDLPTYPNLPSSYFQPEGEDLATLFKTRVLDSNQPEGLIDSFPETALLDHVDNTWGDSARAIFSNWIGLVYQLTHRNRKHPFMDDIDPNDPLGLLAP